MSSFTGSPSTTGRSCSSRTATVCRDGRPKQQEFCARSFAARAPDSLARSWQMPAGGHASQKNQASSDRHASVSASVAACAISRLRTSVNPQTSRLRGHRCSSALASQASAPPYLQQSARSTHCATSPCAVRYLGSTASVGGVCFETTGAVLGLCPRRARPVQLPLNAGRRFPDRQCIFSRRHRVT